MTRSPGPTPVQEHLSRQRPLTMRESITDALVIVAVIIIASTIFIGLCWLLLPALIHETAALIQAGGQIVRGWLA